MHTLEEVADTEKEARRALESMTVRERDQQSKKLKCWQRVGKTLKTLMLRRHIDPRGLLIFCDSVPYPLVRSNRRNIDRLPIPTYRFIRMLLRQGAKIQGTESRMLLACSALAADPMPLVVQRDLFVAMRIATELQEGDTGVLIMGATHRVDAILPTLAPDIRIICINSFLSLRKKK